MRRGPLPHRGHASHSHRHYARFTSSSPRRWHEDLADIWAVAQARGHLPWRPPRRPALFSPLTAPRYRCLLPSPRRLLLSPNSPSKPLPEEDLMSSSHLGPVMSTQRRRPSHFHGATGTLTLVRVTSWERPRYWTSAWLSFASSA